MKSGLRKTDDSIKNNTKIINMHDEKKLYLTKNIKNINNDHYIFNIFFCKTQS